ncbi:response regulator transcription factor [Phaeacidiphilus oryzae]|uniref:response regulator transcription factor n=1 Tax=Phaeacidiphilus oryzae TaxID=348818 RepID=UPI00056A4006|nr:response regulator transcription factor [Phaeacidiphilus oryzae]
MTARVLVADDDPAILRSLDRGLRLNGFAVSLAEDGRSALTQMRTDPSASGAEPRPGARPDVLVLDVSLPDIRGTDVCRRLRADGDDTPVLMLSALDELDDRIAGLQAGADDYLVKPFALQELVLRLRALLRRRPEPEDRLRVGPLEVDPATRTVRYLEAEVPLTRREFELLEVLARNAGLVLSRDQLLDRVWGYDFDVRSDVVDTFVSYLRRKLEADGRPRIVHTVRGVGFSLRDPS